MIYLENSTETQICFLPKQEEIITEEENNKENE